MGHSCRGQQQESSICSHLDVWLGIMGHSIEDNILLPQGVEQAVALSQLEGGQHTQRQAKASFRQVLKLTMQGTIFIP